MATLHIGDPTSTREPTSFTSGGAIQLRGALVHLGSGNRLSSIQRVRFAQYRYATHLLYRCSGT